MKIPIAAAMEGISGVVHCDQVSPSHPEYARFRHIMTGDVNAAIRGAFQGGANEVVVSDGHSSGRNILIEEMDPREERPTNNRLVAVDTLGAGEGDVVLWVQGGAARVISEEHRKAPLDVAIVGIIDAVDIADE